jgi:hypothetical protein
MLAALAVAVSAVTQIPSPAPRWIAEAASLAAWHRAERDPKVTAYCDDRAALGGKAVVANAFLFALSSRCEHLSRPAPAR